MIPGTTVTFRAAFTGTAPVTVRWFKEDKEIVSGGTFFIKKDATSSSLELQAVKPSDSARYACQVSNDAGKVDCTALLFVKGARLYQLHGPLTLTCFSRSRTLTSSLRTAHVREEARDQPAGHLGPHTSTGVHGHGESRYHIQVVQR